MNAHSHSYDAWYPGADRTPNPFTGKPSLVLHPRGWARFAGRLVVVASAREMAGLADGPDAAIRLASARGYLADSVENHRLAEMLRARPWDFGAAGAPLVLGAEAVLSRADGGVELSGVECIEGFQRLVVLSHVARERPGPNLDHADVRVEIVTGADRARIRPLSEEAGQYTNAVHPQDSRRRPNGGSVKISVKPIMGALAL